MTTPTQAQIKAALTEFCDAPDYPLNLNKEWVKTRIEAALTAAAQVEGQRVAEGTYLSAVKGRKDMREALRLSRKDEAEAMVRLARCIEAQQNIKAAIIERCAQMAESINISGNKTIAAAIRRLKE